MPIAEKPALNYPTRCDGIDVSQVQSTIDHAAVARAGFKFAVVKASEGTSYADPLAVRHLEGFRDAGMYAFPYAFLRPSKGKPREQVDKLWNSFGDTFPGRLALDLETRDETTSNRYLVDFAEECVQECEALGLLEPVLYTYPDYARRLQPELSNSKLGRCELWMAAFPFEPWVPGPHDVPKVPLPWVEAALWQYSGNGGYRVPGIYGACDRDLFMGTEEDLRAWFGLPLL